MSARLLLLCLAIAANAGCDHEVRGSFVIPGPTVPSSIPTAAPFVWDSRDELDVWVHNAVSRGSMTLEGSGPDAFVRLDRPDQEWVLRGPDLSPPATAIRTARLRYRWRLDPTLSAGASRTAYVTVHFDAPGLPEYQNGQASVTVPLQPSDVFTDGSFTLGQYFQALDVRYVYVSCSGTNRGVFEIDRIEIVR
jgi:hypothetical protein